MRNAQIWLMLKQYVISDTPAFRKMEGEFGPRICLDPVQLLVLGVRIHPDIRKSM